MTKKRGSKRSRRVQEMLNSVLMGRSFRCDRLSGERVKSKCDTDLYVIHTYGSNPAVANSAVVVAEGGKWYVSTTITDKNVTCNRVLRRFIRELGKISPVQYQEPNELDVIATHGITGVVLGLHQRRSWVADFEAHMDSIDDTHFERWAKEYR